MKLSSIKIDAARAEAGDWVSGIPEMGDLRLRVRGLQSAAARALRNRLIRSLPAAVRADPAGIPLAESDQIETQVLLGAILLGWENLEDAPYSPEKAEAFLTNPDYGAFRDAVMWAATRVGHLEAAAREADLGNS